MKRNRVLMLLAAAVSCWSLVSCEPEGLTPDEYGNKPTEEDVFWSVVGRLVDYHDITPDYKGKTFTAIIGSPDSGDESVRVVSVNSIEAAVERFNNLTGASISETTPSYTWQDKLVGSLSWNKTADNSSWATVDVNIPSVPGLHKIIYRSAEQGDVNGSVGDNGSAYYRFGDVIKKRRDDNVTEYWICVRPSFGPEDKGKSHWVTVSPLEDDDIWPYNDSDYNGPFVASNGFEYGIPKNLRNDPEWYQDLAEMLFAIMYPHEWFTNVTNYDKLHIFNDWHHDRVKYHNEAFWKNVQSQWQEKNIVETVFGVNYADIDDMIDPNGEHAGLYFLYEGSKWSISISNKPTLYQIHYTHGTDATEKNMHKQTKKSVSSQVVTPRNQTESNTNYRFNVHDLTQQRPFIKESRFFGDNTPRWIIRYATGEELSTNDRYDPQQPIAGFTANDEVYRYYRDVYPTKNLTDEPEISDVRRGVVNDREFQELRDFTGTAHYKPGTVFKEVNSNNLWFLLKPSGNATHELPENSPYAELVSFEGIQYSANNATATNIVTKDQAIRLFHLIWLFSQEANKKITRDSYNPGEEPGLYNIYKNILHGGHVDVKHLSQELAVPQYNSPNHIGAAESWSIAYRSVGAARQPLLRCISMMDEESNFLSIMYDSYPKEPTTGSSNVYWDLLPTSFSINPITLQDVADQDKVNQYGDDVVARAPLFKTINIPRPFRTVAEPRAQQVSNYAYDLQTWTAGTQPLGMWNEPVLIMRASALYDRGAEWATRTVDGIDLTVVSEGSTYLDDELDATDGFYRQAYDYNTEKERRVNGMKNTIPSWQTIWGQ